MATTATPPELVGLRDIVLAEPVSYVPVTAGWVALGALAVAGLAWWAWRRWLAWRADAYRRRALEELDRLELGLADPAGRRHALASLAPLLKRTVLAFAPRAQVASLSGEPWLRFLDQLDESSDFVGGPGRRVEEAAWSAPEALDAMSDDDARALFRAVETWLRRHRRHPVGAGDG